MRKNTFAALLFIAAVLICILFCGETVSAADPDYLRIHIRADSDDPAAQAVKYRVKDAVVDVLAPYLADCDSKQKAIRTVSAHLSEIEAAADGVLRANGFDYDSHARIDTEEFPERTYRDLTLPAGTYDALILDLGSGSGQNWWCVVYPPLCFVDYEAQGGGGIVYKSKLLEIIRTFFDQKGERES